MSCWPERREAKLDFGLKLVYLYGISVQRRGSKMTPEKRLKSVQNWINGADYDLETAKHMLKSKRYIYVVSCATWRWRKY